MPDPRALLSWRPRLTLRSRLTIAIAALLACVGFILILGVYGFMRWVPSYALPVVAAARSTQIVETTETQAPSAVRIGSQDQLLDTLLASSLALLLLVTALGAALAWILAGRMLRPLALINRAAERAGEGRLDHRIGLDGPRDELSELAGTFDRMLDRLERSFHTHRRFAANASHELRTPLATTKAILDVARDGPRDPNTAALLSRLDEMNRRSIALVEALLDLSDLDSPLVRQENLHLEQIVDAVAEEHRSQAAGAGLTVRMDAERAPVRGDPILLRRLVANLVENAMRHNRTDGWVRIRVDVSDGRSVLTVENSGPPLDEALLSSLGEPLRRGTARIRSSTAGHGLGLAIVLRIAEAHGAAVRFEARGDGGLLVEVAFSG